MLLYYQVIISLTLLLQRHFHSEEKTLGLESEDLIPSSESLM